MLMTLLDSSWTPMLAAMLTGAAVIAIWFALAPARSGKAVSSRMDGYVDRSQVMNPDIEGSLSSRTILPMISRMLTFFGGLMPQKDLAQLSLQLSRAGEPGGLTVLDFVGLRLILAGASVAVALYFMGNGSDMLTSARNGVIALLAGFMLPKFWLNQKIKSRKKEIARALPDALDMLTIGVEAGLAFESALLRVGDQWNNALSQEFRRVVSEMRVGVPRNEALRRLVERTGVEELSTFVAVLIQSNMLGVSISQVLHTQSDQMRLKRRQQAEEAAHAATVKIVVVLVFFILPSLFIVILGPAAPRIYDVLSGLGG